MKNNRRMLKIFYDIWFWFSIICTAFIFIIFSVSGASFGILNIGTRVVSIVILVLLFAMIVVFKCIFRYFVYCFIDIAENYETISNNTTAIANNNINGGENIHKEENVDKMIQNAFKKHEENSRANN